MRVARLFHTFGPRMAYFQRRHHTPISSNLTTHSVPLDGDSKIGPVLDDASFVGTCIAKALLHERIVVPGNGLRLRTLTVRMDDLLLLCLCNYLLARVIFKLL